MKWYTCIIHNMRHVTPVQFFHTRAENATEAVVKVHRWVLEGEPQWTPENIDVPFVFEGLHEKESVDWDAVNKAIGWTDPNIPLPPDIPSNSEIA